MSEAGLLTYKEHLYWQLVKSSFHYVYIITSKPDKIRHYTGLTKDLEARLDAHNTDQVAHTSKHRPWFLETAIAFRSRKKAVELEKYL